MRPHVIWFGEALEESVLQDAHCELDDCDLCMLVRLCFKSYRTSQI